MLQCYDTFLMSHNLTCTKVKTHPNPLITQRIRGYSWKSSILQERDGAENLALPLLILKPMTVVYSPLAHKWSIIVCLERLSSKNRITQEPVQQFPSKINLLVATSHKCPSEVICKNFDMEIIKTPQYLKTSLYPDYPQGQINFNIEDDKDTKKLLQNKVLLPVQKYLPALKTAPSIYWTTASQSNSICLFPHGAAHRLILNTNTNINTKD